MLETRNHIIIELTLKWDQLWVVERYKRIHVTKIEKVEELHNQKGNYIKLLDHQPIEKEKKVVATGREVILLLKKLSS